MILWMSGNVREQKGLKRMCKLFEITCESHKSPAKVACTVDSQRGAHAENLFYKGTIRRPIWRRACWTCSSWPLPDTENQNIRIPIPDTQYPPPNNLHPIPYTQYPYSRFSGHKLEARAMAMASSHGLKRLPWLRAW